MKIGVLTSSRADYGVYQPLLKKLKGDPRFDLEIISFGMHLQDKQGNTIEAIREDNYNKIYTIGTMPRGDSVFDIASGYGALVSDFALFWKEHTFDLIFALGDRWEMSAAVQASIPFELKIAHLYGGETTLGATDNIYRHQISLVAKYHFTGADLFSERVRELIGKKDGIHTVGSISLENIHNIDLPSWSKVKELFSIPFDEFILVTFHPESVGASKNGNYAQIVFAVLKELSNQQNILITGANSDVMSSLYNQYFERLQKLSPANVKLVPVLGKLNYFKAMQQCSLMLGNTSSGIVEAASFNKWVINVGKRQKGRIRNKNIVDVPFDEQKIIEAISSIRYPMYVDNNIYYRENSVENIINVIASIENDKY